ncbi:hypothetical protein TeGR_g4032, partial [Tetraparma gracilis]
KTSGANCEITAQASPSPLASLAVPLGAAAAGALIGIGIGIGLKVLCAKSARKQEDAKKQLDLGDSSHL